MHARTRWAFWIDRGGTFTDCVARSPEGELSVHKVLSNEDSPARAIAAALNAHGIERLDAECDIRMGTTVATNALLEGHGAQCALVVTAGFADLLRIGTGARPHLFSLQGAAPAALTTTICELDARLDLRGEVLVAPSDDAIEAIAADLAAKAIDSVAVSILGAAARPAFEREQCDRLASALTRHHSKAVVVAATDLSSDLGLLGRTQTGVLDARLTPLLRGYVAAQQATLPRGHLEFMQSSGHLCPPSLFRGPGAILSGPAGGVVAAQEVARLVGVPAAVAFDMGGTSTDVSTVDANAPLEHKFEGTVANIQVRAPLLEIHTVAAGGGSVCSFDGVRFDVGPTSVGAVPGPLCYGHPDATALSVTDLNLVLGRIVDDRFPFSLDQTRARVALEAVARASKRSLTAAAAGFLDVANAKMAEAISRVTLGRGRDVEKMALVVLGGAGGQHACAVAHRLGVQRILWHPFAGVLSAFGMGLASTSTSKSASGLLRPVTDAVVRECHARLKALEDEARTTLTASLDDDIAPERIIARSVFAIRYAGTATDLVVDARDGDRWRTAAELATAFATAHLARFGTQRSNAPLELSTLRVDVTLTAMAPPALPALPDADAAPLRRTRVFSGDALHDAPVFSRETLGAHQRIDGPALILDDTGVFVVDTGWTLHVHPSGTVVIDRDENATTTTSRTSDLATRDPVRLTLFANAFMACAEQMGEILRQCAVSTNIRERLDFSCAIFRHDGDLIANAPHIPVHLGAMSESVRAVLRAHPPDTMRPGDAFLTNDPAEGGSHLPDITCVSPVFLDDTVATPTRRPAFFVASRGHHADVGGKAPGSMPPDSTTLVEEGAVLSALRICREGTLETEVIREALTRGPFPARDVAMNLADIQAQLAANEVGKRQLGALVDEWGHATVDAYMGHVLDDAEERVRAAIATLDTGRLSPQVPKGERPRYEDKLDDGSVIAVELSLENDRLVFDFAGTSDEHAFNLNAPHAVTLACVMYALRVLVDAPVPLSSGFLRPIDVRIPTPSLLAPSVNRAVAAGNVETSQRVVDVVLAALDLCAASQGTMNNVTFGDATFGYYETLGGGGGAGPTFDGPSAVQVHMTNTRLTDPELVEARHPLRIHALKVRTESGGAGRHRGGDGLIREYEMLRDLDVSLLTERRVVAPFGLHGASAGACGENLVDGVPVAGKVQLKLTKGQRLTVKTPGGGGFGPSTS